MKMMTISCLLKVTAAEEEFEKAQEEVQKQEIKYQKHREKIQEVMGKHDPLKVLLTLEFQHHESNYKY